jgi:hypothetical protein
MIFFCEAASAGSVSEYFRDSAQVLVFGGGSAVSVLRREYSMRYEGETIVLGPNKWRFLEWEGAGDVWQSESSGSLDRPPGGRSVTGLCQGASACATDVPARRDQRGMWRATAPIRDPRYASGARNRVTKAATVRGR